jgi:hypothetical protein
MARAAGLVGAAGLLACVTGMVIWTTGQDRDLFTDLADPSAATPQAVSYAGATDAGPAGLQAERIDASGETISLR